MKKMKKKLLLLITPFLGVVIGYSQAELTVLAPTNNGTTGLRAPNGTTAHTTIRGVIIVTAAELAAIPNGTLISKLGFALSSGATPGPAGGNIQFYLENTADVTNTKSTTWATAISTMTSVYNGAYSIPSVAGNVDITLSTPFAYTGGSIYVAYDYLGTTFTTTGALYLANSTLAGGWKGQADPTTTPPATIGATSAFRPSIRFTYTNPFTNELSVSGIAGEKGIFNNTIKTSQTVTSVISNMSQGALTNIPVTLTIIGANPYSVTQTIPAIAAGGTSTLLFNNVPTIALGAQTLTVSIPADENNSNNSRSFNQQVQCDTIGYAQSPVPSGGVGFNTGAGLIANRHSIPGDIITYVKSVSNYFPTDISNQGNTLQGFLLDGNGTILDSTALITITNAMLGTKQDFNFINQAIDVSGGDIYVGFRQTANPTTGYFPFANQNNSYVDPNAAATFPLFGGTPAPLGSGLGYMMIEAVLMFGGFDVANSSTAGTLCANSNLTILPTSGYTNYEFFVGGSSVQNGATPTYTSGPLTSDTTFSVTISNGACVLNSNLQTITIVSSLINNISASICPNDTYVFGTQTLTTGGMYSDTLTSVSGCDSIVNLTLIDLLPSSSNMSASICSGESYVFGSQVLTSAGMYTDIVPNAAGCDSTITLNLIVNMPTSSSITLTLCESSYQFGTQALTTSGTYTRTVSNSVGCDSVITLNLTLNPPVSVTTTLSGTTITATATPSANAFQWLDCATGNPIAGANTSSFIATMNGTYAVIASNPNGCADTSACVAVTTVGLDELMLNESISVYPNPVVDELYAVSNGSEIIGYSVMDANGRIVLAKTNSDHVTEIHLLLKGISEGTYILEVTTSEGKVYKPFIKK